MKRSLFTAAVCSCLATGAQAVTFDFEAPAFPLGTTYGTPAHAPGDVVFSDGGVGASVELFTLGGFVGFNTAQVTGHPGPPTSFFPIAINPTQSLTTNNIAMRFDLTGAGSNIRQVTFDYVDLGGDENLRINGFPTLEVAKLKDTEVLAPAGFAISVSEVPVPGGITGRVRITADPFNAIESVLVGGQEFGIDNFATRDPADLDGDGDVDDADFGLAFAAFTGPGKGPSDNPDADLDGDGDVDDADYALAFAAYTGPNAAGAVPEPGALGLLTLGGLMVARRRTRN